MMEEPALTLWRLIASGDIRSGRVPHACEVLGVTKAELAAARARYECPAEPVGERGGWRRAVGALKGVGPDEPAEETIRRHRDVAPYVPPRQRYTTAGRARAAARVFATIRVEQAKCEFCGDDIETGDIVVIDRCHHAGCAK